MTNIDGDVFVPLNDYSATLIGLVRDDYDSRTILFEDILYVGQDSLGITPYSATNNTHYETLEDLDTPLKDNLTEQR